MYLILKHWDKYFFFNFDKMDDYCAKSNVALTSTCHFSSIFLDVATESSQILFSFRLWGKFLS